MQSGFPPHTQWEGRASLGVILLEVDTQELPQEPAPQSPTGAVHISGKCTKPISSGFTFQLKDPVLIAFCPPHPPASSSSMDFLCGAGATIALVLLALVGAVVCSRTSKPTAYTVCSWCEAIKKMSTLIFHLSFFFFLIFNLSTASDTIHHKSISNTTNYVMVSFESKGKGRSFPMLTVLPLTFRNENIISFKDYAGKVLPFKCCTVNLQTPLRYELFLIEKILLRVVFICALNIVL